MEPRISIITLGVANLERSLRFYRDGRGFPTTRRAADGIIFFQTQGTCPGRFIPTMNLPKTSLPLPPVPRGKFSGITLAHNVRSKEEVTLLLAEAERAGGKIEKPAQDTFWGGHSGYFSDPDGYLWEVAWGAFEIREDGSLTVT